MRKKSQNQEKQDAYLLANMIAHVVIDAKKCFEGAPSDPRPIARGL
jgi:hypothetical protein